VSGSERPKSAKPWKESPQKLAGMVDAGTGGGLVSVGAGKGVWISLLRHSGLRVCRSDITGMT